MTHRMLTEKIAALTEAQAAAGTAPIRGSSHRVAKKALGVYKKRVRRNKRRLTRKLVRGFVMVTKTLGPDVSRN